MSSAYTVAQLAYNDLLKRGISKEVARFVLPQGVYSRVYVSGSCRSWIHYLGVRDDEGVAQYEHVELARAIRPVFNSVFPTVSKSCFDKGKDPRDAEIEELKAQLAENNLLFEKLAIEFSGENR
jgi:thymidylate synthase ThyX